MPLLPEPRTIERAHSGRVHGTGGGEKKVGKEEMEEWRTRRRKGRGIWEGEGRRKWRVSFVRYMIFDRFQEL